jgi:hypothetical protein
MVNCAFPSKTYLKALLLVLLPGCLILSAILILRTGPQAVDVKWRVDSLVLLAVLACQAIGVFLSRRSSFSLALISIGLILVVVIGLPLGGRLEIKLALWSILFIEAAVALEPPLTFICQAVCLVLQGRKERPGVCAFGYRGQPAVPCALGRRLQRKLRVNGGEPSGRIIVVSFRLRLLEP